MNLTITPVFGLPEITAGADLAALIAAARERGLWKLYSRIFPHNHASRSLMARMGFKEIGVHEKHGKLDDVWLDCVNVELLIPENIT